MKYQIQKQTACPRGPHEQVRPIARPPRNGHAKQGVALDLDWSSIDWASLFLEVGLVAVDWALSVINPLLQKAGGPLAPILTMILTTLKQIIQEQLDER
jgi:hypothetical protein